MATKKTETIATHDRKGNLTGSVATRGRKVPTAKPVNQSSALALPYVYPKWNLSKDGEVYDEQLSRGQLPPEAMKEKKWTPKEIKDFIKSLKYDPVRAKKVILTPILDSKTKRVKTSDGNKGFVYGPGATSKDGKVWIRIHRTRVLPGESYLEWEAVRDDGTDSINITSSGGRGTTLDGITVWGKLGFNSQGYWIRVLVGNTKEYEPLWEWQPIQTTKNDLRILRQRYAD